MTRRSAITAAVPGASMTGICIILCLGPPTGTCRGADPAPRFEVASIKPVEVQDANFAHVLDFGRRMGPGVLPVSGRRLTFRSATLEQLIAAAFRVKARQLVGPGWLSDKRFDVEAVIPADAPVSQANEMLQTLLQERFGLRAHPSTREETGYLLTVGKGGPNLKVSSRNPSGAPAQPNAESLMGRTRKAGLPGSSHYEYKNCTMERLADTLASLLQSPVEDRTGLKERYDVVLDMPAPLDPNDRDPQPRVLDAVKQLGLGLKPGKIAVQVLVIDSVAKTPTPN